jgi:Tfp pilus assembly pilus retraction ATPase PilT
VHADRGTGGRPNPTGVGLRDGEPQSRVGVAELLERVLEQGASDLHLTAGAKPTVRVNGRLGQLEDYPVLQPAETQAMIYSILTQRQRERLEAEQELDCAHALPGPVPAQRLLPARLGGGRPPAHPPGDQAAGGARHPGPGERHGLPRGFVLVFATLHTQDAPQTVDRVIDVFPTNQQQIRVQLAGALQGVVCQQLVPTADGNARVVGVEIMMATPAIRNLIRDGKTHQIYSAMQAGGRHGMQTMDQSLADLVRRGYITYDKALERCHHTEDFNRLCGRAA